MPGGERAKLLDFGIAKLAEEHRRPGAGLQQTTQVGAMLGTPAYMAPEQCRGDRGVTDRVDVYALGVVLYHMLSGAHPFQAPTPEAVIAMHIYEQPRPLDGLLPDLPRRLTTLVHRMLAKDPAQRPSMVQVSAELDQLGAQSGRLPLAVPPPGGAGHGAVAEPSTLRGAAAQSMHTRSGRSFLILSGLSALVATGLGLWALERTRAQEPAQVMPAPQIAPVAKAPDPPQAPPPPVRVAITVAPEPALLLVDGRSCASPCQLLRAPGTPVHVSASKKGFHPYQNAFVAESDLMLPVVLVPLNRPRPVVPSVPIKKPNGMGLLPPFNDVPPPTTDPAPPKQTQRAVPGPR
jgi:hypothetical protein